MITRFVRYSQNGHQEWQIQRNRQHYAQDTEHGQQDKKI
jgi:hypothetical protein